MNRTEIILNAAYIAAFVLVIFMIDELTLPDGTLANVIGKIGAIATYWTTQPHVALYIHKHYGGDQ